jgi:hypothetical protein
MIPLIMPTRLFAIQEFIRRRIRLLMNIERRRILESFREGPIMLAGALRQFPRKMWVYKHAADGLSIHETVCRMADNEVIEYFHCRSLVANPDCAARESESMEWFGRLGYVYQNIREAMGIIRALRPFTYHFLEKLPEDLWTRPTQHHVSLDRWLANRQSYYLKQIRGMERIYHGWLQATWSRRSARTAYKNAGFDAFVLRRGVSQVNQRSASGPI